MVRISERLQMVAGQVQSHGVVADIGCDHGFTSIYLLQSGLAERVIAMDINRGPLERAREHVIQYGMEERISLRLSDGAKELAPGEADTILISGMGGALICRILQESETVAKAAGELVLSPQSEIHLVRRLLHTMGFQIVTEEMVLEQGKYYVALRAVAGNEVYEVETEYLYGKRLMEEKSPVFRSFVEKEAGRVKQVLADMEHKQLSEKGVQKREELLQEHARLCKVLHRMNENNG